LKNTVLTAPAIFPDRSAQEKFDGKLGKVAMPLRAALTGRTASPSIFEAAAILGQEETCARIRASLNIDANNKVSMSN
jgi:glutamyl-tRNA synthetase